MNEITLPPSPNWYLSNILACSKHTQTVAWGAKNNIIIARQKEDNQALNFSIINAAHKERVTALAFCPKFERDQTDQRDQRDPELLISCGDDDKVKIWNLDTYELVIMFSFNDDKPVVGVDWLAKDHNRVCAVNSDGILLSCNIKCNNSKKIPLGKLTAICLACCPHEAGLVAIGSKTGLIYIVNLDKNGSIIYKMRGHDEEIVSLSWCPSDMNVLNKDNKRDLLLASGAKDKSIFIWKAGGDGRYETAITLPRFPIVSNTQKSKLNSTVGIWGAVCWAEPTVLLTSSIWGELLSWDLSTNKSKPTCQLFHTYHNRGLFSIANVPKFDATSDNWRTNSELTVWTLAQDRWLVCCSKENDNSVKLKYKIPTQGGYIYCMTACPIDTSRIAFGTGDMMLRVWNLSMPHTTTFDITMFWQKIKGKLRSIAWSPDKERSVAFATSEGRVGVFDVINNNAILFRQYHRKTVYKLEWGSMTHQNEDISGVFSCSEGELVVYDIKKPDEKPISIIKEGCTEFAWKPDKLILAIALQDGSIMFYNQNLEKCANTIYSLQKAVNCLAWHPYSTGADTNMSLMKDYLAVASDSTAIVIFDVTDQRTEQLQNKEEMADAIQSEQRNTHKIVATLKGHSDKVVCLAWSPHFSGRLVSGSYDNTVQVWNVGTQELMGTYTGHNAPVLSCMWSPYKAQLIISGSSDFTVRIWDYTSEAQSPKLNYEPSPNITKKKSKQKAKKHKKDKTVSESTSTSNDSINPVELTDTVNPAEAQESSVKKDAPKKREKKTCFPTYNKMLADKSYILSCIKNDMKKIQGKSSELQNEEKNDTAKLCLFCDDEFKSIFANEKSAHITKNKRSTAIEMDLWSNDLKQTLDEAVEHSNLTDFLVSLSTNLSIATWKRMCEAYAYQLLNEGNVEKAVSYFLCIHKIYDAVQAFVNARMYKEAYVLAKFKLASDDPFVAFIIEDWAQHSIIDGQFEQAAHCYMKLGELTKAAKILGHRTDSYSLEVASELAFMNGDDEFGTSLAENAVSRSIIKSDYSKAHSITAKIEKCQYLKVHIDAHEAITSTCKKGTLDNVMLTWLKGESEYKVLQTLKEKYGTSYYNALRDKAINATPENQTMMRLYAAYQVALAATCEERETQLKHIVTMLSDVFHHETEGEKCSLKYIETNFLTHMLSTLDSKKPTDENSIYAKSNYPVSTSIRAYLCTGLINWLMTSLELLSIEEEIQFTEIIKDLLNDAIQPAARDNIQRMDKMKELECQLAICMEDIKNKKEEWKTLTEELDKLRLDKKNFAEERICTPDPYLVFNQALEFSKILRDETNRTQFLQVLDNEYTILNNKVE